MSGLLRSLLNRRATIPTTTAPPAPALGEGGVTQLVQRGDRSPEDRGVRGSPNYIHLSALLHDFCPRRRILQERGDVDGSWNPSSADRVLWAIGRAAEHYVRQQIITSLNYAGVVGTWNCPCETLKYTGYHVPQRSCRRCGLPATVYGEVELFDHELGIVGRPDMLVEFGGMLTVLEFKSKEVNAFNELTSPEITHVTQALSYQRMVRKIATRPEMVNPQAVIFYVSKGYLFRGSPYREYHVSETSHQTVVPSLEVTKSQALLVKQHRVAETIPPRLGVCSSPSSSTAKKCAACAMCFLRSA